MIRKTTCLILAIITVLIILIPSSSVLAADVKVAVAKENVILRTKPDQKSSGQTTVKKGEIMTVIDGGNSDWAHVKYKNHDGYVSKAYVNIKYMDATQAKSTTSSSSGDPTKISQIGTPPTPMKPGDKSNDVKKLQQALKIEGYFRGTCDGDYGEYTENAVKDFQASRGLSTDGVAGAGTIRLLFDTSSAQKSSSSSKYKTEKMGWFSGGSSFIPKNAEFAVKDVRSGITFNVKRWSGYNHMDCEPVSASDSAKMKRVFGGSWNWARRPILILYNGHVIAASMNGMPREENVTPGNDFDGHFCIHLSGSKTHGTDKVDSDHQACVNEAAKATW